MSSGALGLLASPVVLALALGLAMRPLPWHQGVIAGVGSKKVKTD